MGATERVGRWMVGAVVAMCVLAGSAVAQRGMGGMGGMGGGMGGMGRGGRGGGMGRGGGYARANMDSIRAKRDSVLDDRGYAGFVMDHKAPLNLSDSQVTALVKVDSAYHATADTLHDELAKVHAENLAWVQEAKQRPPTDTLTTAERDSVIARRKLQATLSSALRAAQQDDKKATLAQLSDPQQKQAVQMAEGNMEGGGEGRSYGGGGRGGRGGGGGGGWGGPGGDVESPTQ